MVAVDQASKGTPRGRSRAATRCEVLPFLRFANTRNQGVAFGLAGDVSPVLIGAAIAGALLALLAFLALRGEADPLIWLPAGLLVGGALGNLADRVRDGAVTDFIDSARWPTFNLADVAIVVGVVAAGAAARDPGELEPGDDDADEPEPRIVHEDEAVLVVDKPPGLIVHPAPSHRGPTLVDLLGDMAGGGESFRPGIVHRLDKDTSGLMVVARNEEARGALSEQIKAREVEREYLALVEGRSGPARARSTRRSAGTAAGAPAEPSAAPASARPAPTSR